MGVQVLTAQAVGEQRAAEAGAVYLIEDFFQTTGVSAAELGSLELLQNELATRKAIVIGERGRVSIRLATPSMVMAPARTGRS